MEGEVKVVILEMGRIRVFAVVRSVARPVVRVDVVSGAGRGRLAVQPVVSDIAVFVFILVSGISVFAGRRVFVGFVVWAVGLPRFVLRVGAVFGTGGVIEEGVLEGHKNNGEVLVVKNFCKGFQYDMAVPSRTPSV